MCLFVFMKQPLRTSRYVSETPSAAEVLNVYKETELAEFEFCYLCATERLREM